MEEDERQYLAQVRQEEVTHTAPDLTMEDSDRASVIKRPAARSSDDDELDRRRGLSSQGGSGSGDSRSSDSGGEENKSDPSSNHTGLSFDSGVGLSRMKTGADLMAMDDQRSQLRKKWRLENEKEADVDSGDEAEELEKEAETITVQA